MVVAEWANSGQVMVWQMCFIFLALWRHATPGAWLGKQINMAARQSRARMAEGVMAAGRHDTILFLVIVVNHVAVSILHHHDVLNR